jgi:hypothetical protein
VTEAIIVAGSPTNVDLTLDRDLLLGGTYAFSAIGVPCTDSSVTDATSTASVYYNVANSPVINAEAITGDTDVLLYGTDLIWTGTDYLETQQGDLARVSGVQNFYQAMQRRAFASGLPWQANYGPYARDFVNANPQTVATLRGAIIRDLSRDDRVKSVNASLVQAGDSSYFTVRTTPIGEELLQDITLTVK